MEQGFGCSLLQSSIILPQSPSLICFKAPYVKSQDSSICVTSRTEFASLQTLGDLPHDTSVAEGIYIACTALEDLGFRDLG